MQIIQVNIAQKTAIKTIWNYVEIAVNIDDKKCQEHKLIFSQYMHWKIVTIANEYCQIDIFLLFTNGIWTKAEIE